LLNKSLFEFVQLFRNDDLNKRLKTDVERLGKLVSHKLSEIDLALANSDTGCLQQQQQQQLRALKIVLHLSAVFTSRSNYSSFS
jgi:hypothetical protein